MAIDFNALKGARQRPAPAIPPCILVVAGHRPHKLGSRRVVAGVPLPDDGYEWGNPLRERARARLRAETLRLQLRAEFSRVVASEAREIDAMSSASLDELARAAADAEPGSLARDALGRLRAEAGRGDLGAEAARLRALPYVDVGKWRALHVDAALKGAEWRAEWLEPVRCADGRTVERWRAAPLLGASGVAQGFDQDACGVWARLDVPYVAVIPFPGHESRWPAPAQRTYQNVLRHAAGVLYVTPSGRNLSDEEAKAALLARNDRLIAIGDEMISLWDGTSGGTGHATTGFQRAGRRVIRIHPDELREEIERDDVALEAVP